MRKDSTPSTNIDNDHTTPHKPPSSKTNSRTNEDDDVDMQTPIRQITNPDFSTPDKNYQLIALANAASTRSQKKRSYTQQLLSPMSTPSKKNTPTKKSPATKLQRVHNDHVTISDFKRGDLVSILAAFGDNKKIYSFANATILDPEVNIGPVCVYCNLLHVCIS